MAHFVMAAVLSPSIWWGNPGRAVLRWGHVEVDQPDERHGGAGSGSEANLNGPLRWCVALTDPRGSQKTYRYSPELGLEPGGC